MFFDTVRWPSSSPIVVFVLIALYLSIRVVQQYERMVIFRLGRTGPTSSVTRACVS